VSVSSSGQSVDDDEMNRPRTSSFTSLLTDVWKMFGISFSRTPPYIENAASTASVMIRSIPGLTNPDNLGMLIFAGSTLKPARSIVIADIRHGKIFSVYNIRPISIDPSVSKSMSRNNAASRSRFSTPKSILTRSVIPPDVESWMIASSNVDGLISIVMSISAVKVSHDSSFCNVYLPMGTSGLNFVSVSNPLIRTSLSVMTVSVS